MLNQSLRAHKHSVGLNASITSGPVSEFHLVRSQDADAARQAGQPSLLSERGGLGSQPFFVASLQSICAELLAQNFARMPEIDAMQMEQPELYDMVVERLPVTSPEEDVLARDDGGRKGAAVAGGSTASAASATEAAPALPLSAVVPRVVSETYWKRCSLSRWSTGQLSKFTGGDRRMLEKQYGWKRLYLEHVLSDFLLSLRGNAGTSSTAAVDAGNPRGRVRSIGVSSFLAQEAEDGEDAGTGEASRTFIASGDVRRLGELCALCRDYVHTVELPCQYTRLDWYEHLFSRLPGILNFRLSLGASNTGVGYDRAMIGFGERDAQSIRTLLGKYASLEVLRLPQNRLTSPLVRMIAAGLVGNTTLRVLDLSRNTIDDDAVAEAVALLLHQPQFPLQELNLSDNRIAGVGARALADALQSNRTLHTLNLSQNRIPDTDGGAALVRALQANPQSALRELDLGSNALAGATVAALCDVLPTLETLAALNFAGNRRMGGRASGATDSASPATASDDVACEKLCEAVQSNTSLRYIDVRLCNFSTEQVCAMEAAVQSRVEALRAADRAAVEGELRSRVGSAGVNRPAGRH